MDKVVCFVQQYTKKGNRTTAPKPWLDYMKDRMYDFEEFGPDYDDICEDNTEDVFLPIDAWSSFFIVLVFVGSVALLSLAIVNLIETNKKLAQFSNEASRLRILGNVSLVLLKGKLYSQS